MSQKKPAHNHDKDLYKKINAILDEHDNNTMIACEVAPLIGENSVIQVIRFLLETMRIRRLREQAKREAALSQQDGDDADSLEAFLLS